MTLPILKAFKTPVLALSMALLAACGGGGGSDDDAPPVETSEDRLTGQFLDSPVEGLRYQTGGRTGETNANGEFEYVAGHTVSFFIGDVLLGSVIGRDIVTPIDLVPEGSGSRHPKVVNMIRLLQTLDDNGNPDDGIVLSDEVNASFEGASIDLDQAALVFSQDGDLQYALEQATGSTILVDNMAAIGHFEAQLQAVIPTFTVSGTVSGLAEEIQLTLNEAENLMISEDGDFSFDTQFLDGNIYTVTFQAASEQAACVLTNGVGTIAQSDVTDVTLSCPNAVGEQFGVGGSVSGLVGSLRLESNFGEVVTISGNGSFEFTQPLPENTPYSIAVISDPAEQTCSLTGGDGIIADADVNNLQVSCVNNEVPVYFVGGSIAGLTGALAQPIELALGNGVTQSFAGGSFRFSQALETGNSYNVSIAELPVGFECTVFNESGTIASSDVTDIVVNCVRQRFTVTGSVSGHTDRVVVSFNDTLNETISAEQGLFNFGEFNFGQNYRLSIDQTPFGQNCSISNAVGIVTSNIAASVFCSNDPTYQIGGRISGLNGSISLLNNGTDEITLTQAGDFDFGQRLLESTAYAVTIAQQPVGQICAVTNATGTVGTSDIESVRVACDPIEYAVSVRATGLVDNDSLSLNLNGTATEVSGDTSDLTIEHGNALTVSGSLPEKYECEGFDRGIGSVESDQDYLIECQLTNHDLTIAVTGLVGSDTLSLSLDGGASVAVGNSGVTQSFVYGSDIEITESTQNSKYSCAGLPATIPNLTANRTHTINCTLANVNLGLYIEAASVFPTDGVVSVSLSDEIQSLNSANEVSFEVEVGDTVTVTLSDDQALYECAFDDESLSKTLTVNESTQLGVFCSKIALSDFVFQDSQFQSCVRYYAQERGWSDYGDVVELTCGIDNTEISLEPMAGISGIQYFTALQTLDISGHQVTDISELAFTTDLSSLNIKSNPIVDVSVLSGLRKLRNAILVDGKYHNTLAFDGLASSEAECKPFVEQVSEVVYTGQLNIEDYVLVTDYDEEYLEQIEYDYNLLRNEHNNARCYIYYSSNGGFNNLSAKISFEVFDSFGTLIHQGSDNSTPFVAPVSDVVQHYDVKILVYYNPESDIVQYTVDTRGFGFEYFFTDVNLEMTWVAPAIVSEELPQ